MVAELTIILGVQHREKCETPLGPFGRGFFFWRTAMRLFNAIRRRLIRLLVGKMEVCTNVTIANGEVQYDGRHGGAIVENNQFLRRVETTDLSQSAA
jgi:hypothetical protein